MDNDHRRPPAAPAEPLPNFLPEDYLALLRVFVTLAWAGAIGMLALRIGVALAHAPWPELGGFDVTYNAVLAEFLLVTAMLSVLVVRREWFDRVPREASAKLRTLLTLVVVWLTVHHLAAFYVTGGASGPLLIALPLLVAGAFMALPRSGALAVVVLLVGGHAAVALVEYLRWIHAPSLLAPMFALSAPSGLMLAGVVVGLALGLGLQLRRRLDAAGANLHRGSRVNPLTGLYEQEFLMQRLAAEMQRQRRSGGVVTLLMFEFDGFSAFTTAYGYDAGRRALRHAAQALIRHTRHDMDTPARYAPTTFALLLPDARREQANEIAERIRMALMEVSQGALHPRAGMACVVDAGDLSPEAVLAGASQALRHAKPDGVPVQVELPKRA